jgi:BarA-like signal transduction histidine kinase
MEVDPRGLKPYGGVERAQVRKAVSILGHWLLALRAFLQLEADRLRTGGVGMRPRRPSSGRPSAVTGLIPAMSSSQLRNSYHV